MAQSQITCLFYTKSRQWTWNNQYTPYADEYVKERYRYDDGDGRLYWRNTMTAPSHGRPTTAMRFRGIEREPPLGTMWRFTQNQIDQLEEQSRIYYSKSGMPYVKSYLDERKGRPLQDIWADVLMSKSGRERLGYPTQKPLALLERIISASSNEGDVVLDPFCGCGTAIAAAHKLNRQLDWHRHHPPGRRPHEEPPQDRLQHPARPGLPGRRRAG